MKLFREPITRILHADRRRISIFFGYEHCSPRQCDEQRWACQTSATSDPTQVEDTQHTGFPNESTTTPIPTPIPTPTTLPFSTSRISKTKPAESVPQFPKKFLQAPSELAATVVVFTVKIKGKRWWFNWLPIEWKNDAPNIYIYLSFRPLRLSKLITVHSLHRDAKGLSFSYPWPFHIHGPFIYPEKPLKTRVRGK